MYVCTYVCTYVRAYVRVCIFTYTLALIHGNDNTVFKNIRDISLLAYVMFYRVVIFLGRFLAPIFNHI